MPKTKPSSLNKRHDTKADRATRTDAESAMRPATDLDQHVPPELYGDEHELAKKTWRRLRGLYAETDGELITAFDRDSLIEYCLLVEELAEMNEMLTTMKSDWRAQRERAANFTVGTDGDYSDSLKQWDLANALFQKMQGWNARIDGKRKHLVNVKRDLYLTPRSRAGVAPPSKEPEKPKSAMEEVLDT